MAPAAVEIHIICLLSTAVFITSHQEQPQ
uniref:Uncharacterized protein n=1 Tax=Anguilla anguilla TaxID=7936 RepID=A0A0E9URP9_ANGAN